MSHHVLGDIYRNEFLAVVHRDGVAHELRKDGRAPRPRAHHALLALGGESRDFHFQVAIGEHRGSHRQEREARGAHVAVRAAIFTSRWPSVNGPFLTERPIVISSDRKSTRLNSSHLGISYAVFCL